MFEAKQAKRSKQELQKLKNCISAHISRFREEQERRDAQDHVTETNGKLKTFMD